MKHIEATSKDGRYIKVSDDETGKDSSKTYKLFYRKEV